MKTRELLPFQGPLQLYIWTSPPTCFQHHPGSGVNLVSLESRRMKRLPAMNQGPNMVDLRSRVTHRASVPGGGASGPNQRTRACEVGGATNRRPHPLLLRLARYVPYHWKWLQMWGVTNLQRDFHGPGPRQSSRAAFMKSSSVFISFNFICST